MKKKRKNVLCIELKNKIEKKIETKNNKMIKRFVLD